MTYVIVIVVVTKSLSTSQVLTREESFSASSSFWWLQVFLGFWLHDINLCLYFHIIFSSLCLCFLLSLIKILVIGFKFCPGNWEDLFSRILITSANTFFFFQIRSHSQFQGVTHGNIYGETTIPHITLNHFFCTGMSFHMITE